MRVEGMVHTAGPQHYSVSGGSLVGVQTRVQVRRARPLLGTLVEITALGDDEALLQNAVNLAFGRIEQVHRRLSFHDPESELSRLNRMGYRHAVPVGADLWRVLLAAGQMARASGGLFDVTVAPRLVEWGYLPDPGGADCFSGTYKDVHLLPGRRVRFAKPLLVDLGGIAKGYAVDRAVEVLRRQGVGAGLVNAGGDLRAFGNRTFPVHLRHPRAPRRVLPFGAMAGRALATSATYFGMKKDGDHWRSPLVNPLTGEAVTSAVSVSVKASMALWADALTKVVLLGGEQAKPVLARFGAKVWIVADEPLTLDGCHAV